MSIDYTFYITTAKTPNDLVESLGALSGDDDVMSPDEPGLSIFATSVDHPVVQADVEETFGFVPTSKVLFAMDKFHDDLPGLQAKLVRSVIALLNEHEGDAVLVSSAGPPLLLRKSGELYLNQNWSSWKTEPPKGLALDYQLAAL